MTNPTIEYTSWGSLYNTSHPLPGSAPWDRLVHTLTTHGEYPDKFSAPGFGPYVLRPGGTRKDADVVQMTMAVFDADEPGMGYGPGSNALTYTISLLRSDNITHVAYSSYSHSPAVGKYSYRLVIPFSEPVMPHDFPLLRNYLIKKYRIPCNPLKCSGLSHFYFLPSCPPGDLYRETYQGSGNPLNVHAASRAAARSVGSGGPKLFDPARYAPVLEDEDETEPEGLVDLAPYREVLAGRVRSLTHSADYARQTKGKWLRRALDGVALAEKGERNDATAKTAGVIAYALPDVPVATLGLLLRPSVDAMIAAGSSLTHEAVARMLKSARAKYRAGKAARDAAAKERDEALKEWEADFKRRLVRGPEGA